MPSHETLVFADLPSTVWSTPVPIRFGHCDPAGIVYTPEYFNIFNGVIEDWYGAALGISYAQLVGVRRTGLGYVHVSADFATPSSMGEVLRAAVLIQAIGRTSVTLRVYAFKGETAAVRTTFVTVTTSLDTHGKIPIPADLRAAFEAYHAGCPVIAPISAPIITPSIGSAGGHAAA